MLVTAATTATARKGAQESKEATSSRVGCQASLLGNDEPLERAGNAINAKQRAIDERRRR